MANSVGSVDKSFREQSQQSSSSSHTKALARAVSLAAPKATSPLKGDCVDLSPLGKEALKKIQDEKKRQQGSDLPLHSPQ